MGLIQHSNTSWETLEEQDNRIRMDIAEDYRIQIKTPYIHNNN
jgi:hypothetical protein